MRSSALLLVMLAPALAKAGVEDARCVEWVDMSAASRAESVKAMMPRLRDTTGQTLRMPEEFFPLFADALMLGCASRSARTPMVEIAEAALSPTQGLYGEIKRLEDLQIAREEAEKEVAFYQRFNALEESETRTFWTCVMGGGVDIDVLSTSAQLGALLDGARSRDPKGFAKRLETVCAPGLDRALVRLADMHADAPGEFVERLERYEALLPKLQHQVRLYARTVKTRAGRMPAPLLAVSDAYLQARGEIVEGSRRSEPRGGGKPVGVALSARTSAK